MITVQHVDTCPIVSILFHGQDWQRGVLKLMKSDQFLVSLVVCVFFPKFGKQVKEWLS